MPVGMSGMKIRKKQWADLPSLKSSYYNFIDLIVRPVLKGKKVGRGMSVGLCTEQRRIGDG